MIRNYIKIAWRSFVRNSVYSTINIIGLGVGLATCMLILLYTVHEWSYDSFHKDFDKIRFVETVVQFDKNTIVNPNTKYSLGEFAQHQIPSVEGFSRIKEEESSVIQNPESPELMFFEDGLIFADSNFFSFFSFDLLKGDKNRVLKDPFTMVITQKTANKYFGNMDPIGEILRYENTYDFVITGVASNPPSNSSINFDFVISLQSLKSIKEYMELGEMPSTKTFLSINEKYNVSSVQDNLDNLQASLNTDKDLRINHILYPINQLHIESSSSENIYLKVFPIIALLILILAIINYVSLSTAHSTIKSKEVGIRKVLGAKKTSLALQFFVESSLYTAISFILGILLLISLKAFLIKTLQINIDYSFLLSSKMVMLFLILFLSTILLASIYPSILLSSFSPIKALYQKFGKERTSLNIRRFFTVFQFSVSIILIVCGIMINRQIYFFGSTQTGVNRESVVMVPFTETTGEHHESFRNEIESISGVEQIGFSNYPLYGAMDMTPTFPQGSSQMIMLPTLNVDKNFISILGLNWKMPPANIDLLSSQNATAIINESAVEMLNLENSSSAIGEQINGEYRIQGVLKDFNYQSLHNKINGLCLIISTDSSKFWSNGGVAFIKFTGSIKASKAIIDRLKSIHDSYDPNRPFQYTFLDQSFEALYKAEEKLAKIFNAFMILSILIAFLGLYGLATFMAVRRRKEIGVRKVLGASTNNMIYLLTWDFIKLVMVSVVIANPIAWWLMYQWLQGFASRVNINWWVFAVASLSAISVSLLAISAQASKAASVSPAKSLRTE